MICIISLNFHLQEWSIGSIVSQGKISFQLHYCYCFWEYWQYYGSNRGSGDLESISALLFGSYYLVYSYWSERMIASIKIWLLCGRMTPLYMKNPKLRIIPPA